LVALEMESGTTPQRGQGGPTLRRFVVGYDESEGARVAGSFALWLAARVGAQVVLAHVCPSPPNHGAGGHVVPDLAERALGYEERWHGRLQRLRELSSAPENVEVRLLRGSAPGGLVWLARSIGADAVFAGLRGNGTVRHALPGSTAVGLLQHATCPVMLFPESAFAEPELGAGAVMVGVDGSAGASHALAYAQPLAAAIGADLVVVHIVDMRVPFVEEPTDAMRAELLRNGRDVVHQARREIAAPVNGIREEVFAGRPCEDLTEACERHGARIAVVGSRGCGGFEGLTLGSTARVVVDHAVCPVLVTRPLGGVK
jgi:nucleotide-binding universal stress UspA family protein